MSHRFLRAGIAACLSMMVSACGAKVTVDATSGSGGHGGAGGAGHGGSTSTVSFTSTTTGNEVTSVTVGPTTGVGPGPTSGVGPMMCGCDEFCNAVKGCGFPAMQCMKFCNQAPQQIIDCVCMNAASCNLQMCFGMGPGGSTGGPGATGGSTGSGGAQCGMCANDSVMGACAMQDAACNADMACVSILDCHQNCGWTPQCKQQCEGANPNGVGNFNALIDCAVCQSCGMQCQGTQLFGEYCVMPP